jgi:DNA-binding transcriptional LysR family regulator
MTISIKRCKKMIAQDPKTNSLNANYLQNSMKLNAIRDFLAVVERGGLRAAARQLHGSQPAISRSIQELEKELGVVLLDRRPGGATLTPMGNVFHRRASAVQNELRLAQEELDQLRGETNGNLRIALSSVPHIALLPSSLRPFRVRFPNVNINIIDAVFPKIELDLRESRVDFYVGPAPSDISKELIGEKLFDNTRVIVGRKNHPLAQAKSLRDLIDAEWITTSITHIAEEELGPLFESNGLPEPRLVLQAHSTLTFLTALMNTDLLMMLPIQWTQSPVLRDFVQAIEIKEVLPAPPVSLVRRTGMPLTPAAEYFSDVLKRAVLHMDA